MSDGLKCFGSLRLQEHGRYNAGCVERASGSCVLQSGDAGLHDIARLCFRVKSNKGERACSRISFRDDDASDSTLSSAENIRFAGVTE
jgi:hypothetical protein